MSQPAGALPGWANKALLPALNIISAFLVTGIVFLMIGESPIEAAKIMLYGAFGYQEGFGYTLYYTTNFIFTGLAVAVAFHAGLFNIGGEGQAYIGGLGAGLACLALDAYLPAWILIPLAVLASALFGAAWAFLPGYLQARRGSHVVITTIMFNFLASSLMVYLLSHVLKDPGQMSSSSREFAEVAWLPFIHNILAGMGISFDESPLNVSFFLALVCCVLVWLLIWRTRWGYELRTVGSNSTAAVYAGIKPAKVIIWVMCLSGALAGLVGVNEILGVQHRLLLDFSAGYGFVGIAVALMGRNHPVGIVLASLLFGALYQGGAELAFDMPNITRDMVVMIQGLIILFCGALEFMYRPLLVRLLSSKAA
ncbi:sugar ABC transporter permease [Pokkaliibacter plantistimulans]|uniref:Sugar ABC transporter permease n=1 Tax=Proteobacteria bacterium 228 TaxID=2083153 RepID=A0A2S5KR13_9PROT|nr:ABC transporter permease [Pokkaliibacter plantistimulans]PPC77291.1 sugar ABC transporter permease [Pokkaliibacter plantistimulans]